MSIQIHLLPKHVCTVEQSFIYFVTVALLFPQILSVHKVSFWSFCSWTKLEMANVLLQFSNRHKNVTRDIWTVVDFNNILSCWFWFGQKLQTRTCVDVSEGKLGGEGGAAVQNYNFVYLSFVPARDTSMFCHHLPVIVSCSRDLCEMWRPLCSPQDPL